MRVLYYCPEYYAEHGARTHAQEFFRALQGVSGVDEAFIYGDGLATGGSRVGVKKNTEGRAGFLPKPLRRFYHFWKPKKALTRDVLATLKRHSCDVLIVRSGARIPSLRDIKRQCPDVTLCVEINAAFFDEAYPNIPFRRSIQQLEVDRFSHADSFFTVSRYLKDYLVERGLSEETVLINQNAVNVDVFHPLEKDEVFAQSLQLNIPHDAFVLGYVGGMEVFRRLPDVIDLFAKLRRQGSDNAFLLIVGDGTDRAAVEAKIKEHWQEISGWVACLGWQPYESIPKLISLFDLAIFPFTNPYCSPLKLFEYLAMEKAVLGPDTPAVREVFTEGQHLALVKSDGSDFCAKVVELMNSTELRVQLAEQGRLWVTQNYTWEKNATDVVEHIRSCSSEKLRLS